MKMNNWILRFEGAALVALVAGEVGGAIFLGMAAIVLHTVQRYK